MRTGKILFLMSIWIIGGVVPAMACHKGGALGYASGSPLMSTTDYVLAPIWIFASTSGTSGCENWDLVQNSQEKYIDQNWNHLAEEAAQGKGEHLDALAQLLGCTTYEPISQILHKQYTELFLTFSISENNNTHLFLNQLQDSLKKNGLATTCRYVS